MRRFLILLNHSLTLWSISVCFMARASDRRVNAGPLWQDFPLTLEPGHRTEIIAPLYHRQVSGDSPNRTKLWAFPPFFSRTVNEDIDYEQNDILWRGITYNRYGQEYRFQILQLLSFAGGSASSPTNAHRLTLFPIYFQQRSSIQEENYTAVLPFYGTLKHRLFRDEIHFVLFPLYVQGRKKDVVTDNFVYPFFHLRHGDHLTGWQLWPLLGSERKETTRVTNHWDEAEVTGGHEKFFVFWPFFESQHSGIGTTNQSRQRAVIPFYSLVRSPQRDSTTFGWPIGVTHSVDREKRYSEWDAPWPLIVFADGEGKNVRRVWPFFSQAHNAALTSDWYLWPVYKYNRLHSDPLDRERTRILWFLYSDVRTRNTEDHTQGRQVDLWPLFTYHRDLAGRRRLQMLSLLEAYLPNNTSVERDLSPLWSVWRAENNPGTGASSQSLLWNLYRSERTRSSRKCSLLFGLFQYQSGPDGRRWRVCYIPVGQATPPNAPAGR